MFRMSAARRMSGVWLLLANEGSGELLSDEEPGGFVGRDLFVGEEESEGDFVFAADIGFSGVECWWEDGG